jgi:hypothetical protein
MEKLLERSTTVSAGEFPKLVRCSWPLGKVTLYRDRIVLDARVERYELLFSEIDSCRFNFLQVNIEHHNPDVPKELSINGVFISRVIKNAIVQHGLPVRVE